MHDRKTLHRQKKYAYLVVSVYFHRVFENYSDKKPNMTSLKFYLKNTVSVCLSYNLSIKQVSLTSQHILPTTKISKFLTDGLFNRDFRRALSCLRNILCEISGEIRGLNDYKLKNFINNFGKMLYGKCSPANKPWPVPTKLAFPWNM